MEELGYDGILAVILCSAISLYLEDDFWSPLGREGYLIKVARTADLLVSDIYDYGVEPVFWPPWRVNGKVHIMDVHHAIKNGGRRFCNDIIDKSLLEKVSWGKPVGENHMEKLARCKEKVLKWLRARTGRRVEC